MKLLLGRLEIGGIELHCERTTWSSKCGVLRLTGGASEDRATSSPHCPTVHTWEVAVREAGRALRQHKLKWKESEVVEVLK